MTQRGQSAVLVGNCATKVYFCCGEGSQETTFPCWFYRPTAEDIGSKELLQDQLTWSLDRSGE